MPQEAAIEQLLERARLFAAGGDDDAAQRAYIELLTLAPDHFNALNELGNVALASGHRQAARTAYRRAVERHPQNPLGHINLGNLYFQDGDLAAARIEYDAALAAEPGRAEAHQGLARTLDALGETSAAEPHWRLGFDGHAIVRKPFRGRSAPVKVLLLVSARFGNIFTDVILDDRLYEVTALYVDYHDHSSPLPDHAVVFNAIGDADLCGQTLTRAAGLLRTTDAPIINRPERVLHTGRVANARRLASVPGLVTPTVLPLPRSALGAPDALSDLAPLTFPLLVRTPGHHMGHHFVRVERSSELSAAIADLPGEELLLIEPLNARGPDGLVRKFRVMIIDGVLYPLHLAISADWKVHYFSAAMAENESHRQEEARFLTSMPDVIGVKAMTALQHIAATLDLDYAGVDFGLARDGEVLLFEANATMVIVPPPADPLWEYRRAAIDRALQAAKRLVRDRAINQTPRAV